jgi:hypothetical protein
MSNIEDTDTESILSEVTTYYSDEENEDESEMLEIFDEFNNIDDIVEQKYYVGTYSYSGECFNNIISFRIPLIVFYKYTSLKLIRCMEYINPYYEFSNIHNIDIIQVFIHNEYYIAVIKTFWLKIIQRTWRKIYLLRKRIVENRRTLASIRYTQLHGYYPHGLNHLPTIAGMMAIYS